ncbi:MAG: hypothetical protein CL799_02050 [Chromatiales bacterium]|jgi:hypothetical protein|nr:hypothetical protein [Chromatiales bacterium]
MSNTGSGLKAFVPAPARKMLKRFILGDSGNAQGSSDASNAPVLFDDFLSPEEFLKVQHWALSLPTDVTREDRDWSIYITLDFGECLMSRMWLTDDDDLPPEAQLFVDRVRELDLVDDDASILLGVYRWQPSSGIGEHSDAHMHTAITFYLNDVWKPNWFGDLIFYKSKEDRLKGIGHAVSPTANRLVINKHTVYHKVTYSSKLAVERISLQAFVVPKKDGSS